MDLLDLSPDRLRRYSALARLLVRYGRRDLVVDSGLAGVLGDELDDTELEDGVADRAASFAADLESMGATYVKLGQLLSTRADLLPEEYLDELSRLQDAVDPLPIEAVREIIEAELGARVSKLFDTFDERPLAAASLAQVHQATMRDGTSVAVKVQRPGVRTAVAEDLAALTDLAELFERTTDAGERYNVTSLVDEFRRTISRELDYRRETQHLRTLSDNLSGYDRLVVPQPVVDYCTSRVLTMQLVTGRKVTELSPLRHLHVDGEAIADELFRAYLQQMLSDGFVHADPHPGNVFMTDDDRVALLDLGMVVRVKPDMQEQLLRLLLAVAEGEFDDAADAAIALGDELDRFDEPAFRRGVTELVTTYLDLPPEHLRIGRIVLQLSRLAGQTGLRPRPELSLLGRTLLNLDAVGRAVAPTFDPNAAIRSIAAEVASESVLGSLAPSQLLRTFLDSKELAESMPGRLNRISRSLEQGTFRIEVDAVDEHELLRAIQKVANRVTVGLILASLIVGAAMLMRVETEARILGYPALAMVFFVLAAIGGFGLVVSILWSDRTGRRP